MAAVCECGHIMVVHTCFKRREDNHCHDGCECPEYVEAKMAEPEVMAGTIDITPEWENTLEWMAVNMAQHGFNRDSYAAIGSILSIARYLARSTEENRDKLDRVIKRLEERK